MKNKLKSILALLLMIALVATNFITVSAAVKKGDVFTYEKMKMKITKTATTSEPGEVIITSYINKKSTKALNIPDTVEYDKKNYKVTSIDYSAFKNSKFTKVTIPSTITNIKDSAFMKCTNLTSVEIPKNVILGRLTFRECTSLKTVILGEGIKNIPTSTFYGCTQLTTVNIPDTVSKIDNFAFSKTNIKKIVLPEDLTEIGQDAFSNCKALTSIYIPSTVKTVGRYAFKGCTNLTATIPKYTLYEKDLIDSNIKYNYSNESVFLVEQIEANAPENGIIYYKITNNTTTTYSYFQVECLLLDSAGDQVGGSNSNLQFIFKPGDSTVFGVLAKDKTYTDIKLITSGNILNKGYKDMSSYIAASLHDDKTINYDHLLEITSTSPKKIDSVDVEIVFYKDNKIVYMSNCSFNNVYKGDLTQPFYLPADFDYNSYTTNVTAFTLK